MKENFLKLKFNFKDLIKISTRFLVKSFFCFNLKKTFFIFLYLISFSVFAQECPNWSKEVASQKFENLKHKLNQANKDYRKKGKSNLSDQEYDYLKSNLLFWQNCFDFLEKQPKKDKLFSGKTKHPVVHTGLYKAKSEQEVNSFLHKNATNEIWLMPKIDGVALSLIYKKGKLIQAISRGDGIYGEDVTKQVKLLKNLPQKLNENIDLILQGELYWIHKNRIEAEAVLSNAREKVSAYLMQESRLALSSQKPVSENEKLQNSDKIGFFAWEVPSLQTEFADRLDFLTNLGFGDTKNFSYRVKSLKEVKKLKKQIHTSPLKFATDGIVLTSAKRPDYKKWKVNDKYWAIGWKHEFKTSLTKITKISYKIGRTGKITPMVYFEELTLGGRKYTRASLGSLKKLEAMNLKVDDIIELELAGGIIPQVKKLVWQSSSSKKTKIPNFSQYTKTTCMKFSQNCKEQFLARLVYMSEKLPIKGVKEGGWNLLLEANLIKNLHSWREIKATDLQKIAGFGDKKTHNFLHSFKKAKKEPFTKYLIALGLGVDLRILNDLDKKLSLKNSFESWSKVSLLQWQKAGLTNLRARNAVDFLQALLAQSN